MKRTFLKQIGMQAARFGLWRLKLMYGERDVTEPIPEVRAGIGVEVRLATKDDLDSVDAAIASPEDLRLFRLSRESGAICFVAWVEGRPAGYSWLNLDALTLSCRVLRRLPPGYGYQCDSVVFPEFRGRKLFQKLSAAIYVYLREQGRRYACNLVARDNAASIEARRKLGATFRPVTILKFPFFPPFVAGGALFEAER